MRVGKVPAVTAAIAGTAIGIPDVAGFVFVYYETDSTKLCVKKSDGTTVRTAALT